MNPDHSPFVEQFFRRVAVLVLIISLVPVVMAQQAGSSPATRLSKIEFTGLQHVTKEDAVAASGLRIGAIAGPAEFKQAADRLLQVGIFKKVSYQYRTMGDQSEISFEVEEAKWNVPVVFDNFIWFTDEELTAAVRKDLPSFDGTAPESSVAISTITRALDQLLALRNMHQSVEEISQSDFNGRNLIHIFSIKGVNLPVCTIKLEGNSTIKEGELREEAKTMFQGQYSRAFAASFAIDGLLKIFRQRGRLRAKFGTPQARKLVAKGCNEGVEVTIPVDEGLVYSWGKPQWTGNQAIPIAELEGCLELKSGQVADGLKIDNGIKALRKRYGKEGYIRLKLTATPDYDDSERRVVYRIAVEEGTQYHMGKLILTGFAAADEDRLRKRWKLQPGQVFDASYMDEYLKTIEGLMPPGPKTRQRTVKENLDNQNGTVDVSITAK